MRKAAAFFCLMVFLGFLGSLSVNYSGFLEMVNAGDPSENVNLIPEETEEEIGDQDPQEDFVQIPYEWLSIESKINLLPAIYQEDHWPWYYEDTPYAPPELA